MIYESATRRVSRVEPDGKTIVLAIDTKKCGLTRPNDLTIDSKGGSTSVIRATEPGRHGDAG
jgi:hypothetical protein